MSKALDKELKLLGFTSITRSLRACRAGELVHAVSIGKDRHGSVRISAFVWISSLAGDDTEFELRDLQTPLAGNASPGGLHSSWTWPHDVLPTGRVLQVLRGFFGQHITRADMRRSLDGGHIHAEVQRLIETGRRRSEIEARVIGEANYPLRGGALGLEEAHSRAKDFLSRVTAPLGFGLVEGSDVVAIREAGEVQQCVRILIDEFGTFASAVVFPWTRTVWKADPRWVGTYYPMISADLQVSDAPWLAELPDLEGSATSELQDAIEASLQCFGDIRTARDFCERLGRDWSTIGAQLRVLL